MALSQRENLMKLWRREGYEYVPVHFLLCPALKEEFKKRCGDIVYQDYFNFPFRYVGLGFKPQDIDWKVYYPGVEFNPGTTFSVFGVACEPHPGSMHMHRMHHPMKSFTSLEQFQAYPYPELDESGIDSLKAEVEYLHKRGLAACGCPGCLWENSWYMRSMEELMMDMFDGNEKASYHFKRITDITCGHAALLARAGVDFIHMGDDIGMQESIMMSEEMYREWLKPLQTRLVKTVKDINPEILFSYHSCGYIEPFIPDLIDSGIDILNPIQPESMSFEKIHAEYGDVLSFWGTIGTQTTMPFGTPEDVRKDVNKNLKIAGPKGGLLCTPTHLLEPDVLWENIEAYVQACHDFSL
ncbi:MAG: uroporphyrinogen decarboxylase family protein [Victivallaceae bacterium]